MNTDIIILAENNQSVTITKEHVLLLPLIKEKLDSNTPMIFPDISKSVFDFIINYLNIKSIQHDANTVDIITPLNGDDLISLTVGANMLGVTELVELCEKRLTNIIHNSNPEGIRNIFKLNDDFTPEERIENKKHYKTTL